MSRYIDADPLEKQLNRYVEYNDDGEQEINADEVFITLHEQPTADVRENVKGEWIPVTKIYKVTEDQFPNMHIEWVDASKPDEIDAVRCSECGEVFDFQDARNWCAECGADMRGENNT